MAGTIVRLPEQVAALPAAERALFERIFHLNTATGEVAPPPTMTAWIEKYFGSMETVRRQRIVKLTNRVTWEGTLYNELRALRPIEPPPVQVLADAVAESEGGAFCRPLEGTPADLFGRIEGQHSITASNVAKYDGFHGLVVFDQHHPLHFDRQAIADYLQTGRRWAQAAHAADPEAVYYFFMWNCLWKSGASILHGHAQTTVSRGMHYARVEALRRAAKRYRARYGSSYFEDLTRVHRALGLARSWGAVEVLAYLTPIKEKEMLLIGPTGAQRQDATAFETGDDFVAAFYAVLRGYVDRLGVRSFNVAFCMPPLAPVREDWSVFPAVLARIVDRGNLATRTADFGAMELYASSVVASDPFHVMEAFDNTAGP